MPKSASYLPWRFSNDGAKFLVLEISFFGRKYKIGGSIGVVGPKRLLFGGVSSILDLLPTLGRGDKWFSRQIPQDDFVTFPSLNAKK